jgi:hypothetical protein
MLSFGYIVKMLQVLRDSRQAWDGGAHLLADATPFSHCRSPSDDVLANQNRDFSR